MKGREELAEVLADHWWDMSDEQRIDGVWTWGVLCECGEFVPGGQEGTHVADVVLAWLADRLADEGMREAVEVTVGLLPDCNHATSRGVCPGCTADAALATIRERLIGDTP